MEWGYKKEPYTFFFLELLLHSVLASVTLFHSGINTLIPPPMDNTADRQLFSYGLKCQNNLLLTAEVNTGTE